MPSLTWHVFASLFFHFKTIDMGCILQIKYFGVLCQMGTDGEVQITRIPLFLGTRPASRTSLHVQVEYTAGAATFCAENVTAQLKLLINGFGLLCDRMTKFRVTHYLSKRVHSLFL